MDRSGLYRALFDKNYGTFDKDAAMRILTTTARMAEPEITQQMRKVERTTGGRLERLGTRLKSEASVSDKLDRFAKKKGYTYRLGPFNDTVRYTIVFSKDAYVDGCMAVTASLEVAGYAIRRAGSRWSGNYRGLNVTVRSPEGFHFEVHLHTPRSLEVAEETHPIYEQRRNMDAGSPEWRRLYDQEIVLWRSVNVPVGADALSRRMVS
jgi:hypothetical protein